MKQFLVFIAILLYCNLYAQDFNVEEYLQKGLAAYQNAQYEEAINYLTPCEEYCSQFSDSISKSYDAVLLSIESIAHSALGNHKKALGYGEKASIPFWMYSSTLKSWAYRLQYSKIAMNTKNCFI